MNEIHFGLIILSRHNKKHLPIFIDELQHTQESLELGNEEFYKKKLLEPQNKLTVTILTCLNGQLFCQEKKKKNKKKVKHMKSQSKFQHNVEGYVDLTRSSFYRVEKLSAPSKS